MYNDYEVCHKYFIIGILFVPIYKRIPNFSCLSQYQSESSSLCNLVNKYENWLTESNTPRFWGSGSKNGVEIHKRAETHWTSLNYIFITCPSAAEDNNN